MSSRKGTDLLTARRQVIEAYLEELADGFGGPASLTGAMSYSLLGGGKRIRPLLVLASGGLAGLPEEAVLPLAAALEMIHTYSLIHDDLPAMDNDDLRRGRPTSHKVYGEALAILAGDALLNEAMLHLAKTYGGDPLGARAMVHVMTAAGKDGMIGGQVLDIESEGRAIDLATLEAMHRGKTGALIEAALAAPFLLAGRPEAETARLSLLGRDLGVLFQIQDDILDVESDARTMGKTVGKDERDHKSTYVSLLGLDKARDQAEAIKTRIGATLALLGEGSELLECLLDAIYQRNH